MQINHHQTNPLCFQESKEDLPKEQVLSLLKAQQLEFQSKIKRLSKETCDNLIHSITFAPEDNLFFDDRTCIQASEFTGDRDYNFTVDQHFTELADEEIATREPKWGERFIYTVKRSAEVIGGFQDVDSLGRSTVGYYVTTHWEKGKPLPEMKVFTRFLKSDIDQSEIQVLNTNLAILNEQIANLEKN